MSDPVFIGGRATYCSFILIQRDNGQFEVQNLFGNSMAVYDKLILAMSFANKLREVELRRELSSIIEEGKQFQ